MDELKQCPFCGGEAILRKNRYCEGYYVTCLSHNCSMIIATCQRETKEEAIEAWNRRASDDERRSDSKS